MSARAVDFRLLTALAAGATNREAGQVAGVSERTVRRRMADPGFRARVHDVRGEMLSRALGELTDASVEAAATLRKLLTARPPTVRLGAARAILELATRLRESTELGERVAAIENRIAVQPKTLRRSG